MHFFIEHLQQSIPGWKPGSAGWIVGNCPACVRMGEPRPDTRRRGGFQFGSDNWVYHCFNCKFKTGWHQGQKLSWGNRVLLEELGLDQSSIQRLNIELLRDQDTVALLTHKPDSDPLFKPNWPTVELPADTCFLNDEKLNHQDKNLIAGLDMIVQRNLDHWTDWAFNNKTLKFRKRLFLPYRYRDQIVGYSARLIGNNIDKNSKKYIVQKPKHFLFNLDRQRFNRKTVIVVEGDYDAISIDGVSVGTNTLDKQQISLIDQLNKKTVVLPDSDSAGLGLVEAALENGWAVSFPEWMDIYKDANEATMHLGRSMVVRSILTSAIDNTTKIKVLAKRYLK